MRDGPSLDNVGNQFAQHRSSYLAFDVGLLLTAREELEMELRLRKVIADEVLDMHVSLLNLWSEGTGNSHHEVSTFSQTAARLAGDPNCGQTALPGPAHSLDHVLRVAAAAERNQQVALPSQIFELFNEYLRIVCIIRYRADPGNIVRQGLHAESTRSLCKGLRPQFTGQVARHRRTSAITARKNLAIAQPDCLQQLNQSKHSFEGHFRKSRLRSPSVVLNKGALGASSTHKLVKLTLPTQGSKSVVAEGHAHQDTHFNAQAGKRHIQQVVKKESYE